MCRILVATLSARHAEAKGVGERSSFSMCSLMRSSQKQLLHLRMRKVVDREENEELRKCSIG